MKSLKVKLYRFFQWPASRQALLLQALGWVFAIRLGLWLLPFPILKSILSQLPARRLSPRSLPPPLIGWAVRAAGRAIPKATCLVQALAAQALLKSQGYPSEMHLGVRHDEVGNLLAHAWVECQGQVIIGDTASVHYQPLQAPRPHQSS